MQDDWKASFFAFFPNIWVTWFAQLQTNKFEGLFKDKLQFSTTLFDSFNPLWSTYWLKHVIEEPFKQGGNPGNEVLFQAYPHEYSLIKKAKEKLDKTMFFD